MIKKKYLRFSVIVLIIVLLDQITKIFLTTTINHGAAFGILQNQRLFLILVSIIALIVIPSVLRKVNGSLIETGLAFLFAGTLGNLIDRVFLDHVRDFISIWIWPSFNVADSVNCIAVFLILVWMWKTR